MKRLNRDFNRDEMTTILAKAVARCYEAEKGKLKEDESGEPQKKAA